MTDFLASHPDSLLSADEITDALEASGISRSAVYRNLAALEADGKIRRASKEGDRRVYFQYLDVEDCKDAIHLFCKKCGRTIHMETSAAEALVKTIEGSQSFTLDKTETVLYGTCGECAANALTCPAAAAAKRPEPQKAKRPEPPKIHRHVYSAGGGNGFYGYGDDFEEAAEKTVKYAAGDGGTGCGESEK
ncbi:MAG: transcriptional repressor [Clostridia bacterium]|nr:transcriptional repressor [Clostridia bacterium]